MTIRNPSSSVTELRHSCIKRLNTDNSHWLKSYSYQACIFCVLQPNNASYFRVSCESMIIVVTYMQFWFYFLTHMCLTKSFRCSHVVLTMFLYFDYYTGNPVLVIVPMAYVTVSVCSRNQIAVYQVLYGLINRYHLVSASNWGQNKLQLFVISELWVGGVVLC